MRIHCGLSTLALLAIFSPTSALAQDWTGWTLAIDGGTTGSRNSNVSIVLDPAEMAGFNYAVFAGHSGDQAKFDRTRNLPRASDFGLTLSRTFVMRGDWIAGAEGQLRFGGSGRNDPVGSPRVSDAFALNDNGDFVTQNTDSFGYGVDIQKTASLRVRVGHPVNERLLISAFAGAAWVEANLDLRQNTTFDIVRVVTMVPRPRYRPDTAQASTLDNASDNAFGVTFGGIAEWRLTDQFGVRAEAGLSYFDDLAIDSATGGTRFSIAPQLYHANLGLTYRF